MASSNVMSISVGVQLRSILHFQTNVVSGKNTFYIRRGIITKIRNFFVGGAGAGGD